jgi:F-type H+-transporting ATPase subunit gamma
MSDSAAALRGQIASAGDLQTMARTMKTVSAANIAMFDNAVRALDVYYDSVQLSLSVCLRDSAPAATFAAGARKGGARLAAVVFGSDQGLVGQFNESMRAFTLATLATLAPTQPGARPPLVWPVGVRIAQALDGTPLELARAFDLPHAIDAVSRLVGELLRDIEARREHEQIDEVIVFHQRPAPGAQFAPAWQRLLPLDAAWTRTLLARPWPGKAVPETLAAGPATLAACLSEYLFVSLYRACAESLASENAARLAAMQRAEKNIGDLLQGLTQSFHRLRQGRIDEELFDLVAGFDAQSRP